MRRQFSDPVSAQLFAYEWLSRLKLLGNKRAATAVSLRQEMLFRVLHPFRTKEAIAAPVFQPLFNLI
jgi:hypothetical protein